MGPVGKRMVSTTPKGGKKRGGVGIGLVLRFCGYFFVDGGGVSIGAGRDLDVTLMYKGRSFEAEGYMVEMDKLVGLNGNGVNLV